jgi:probable HAF family extracellular repeat protein
LSSLKGGSAAPSGIALATHAVMIDRSSRHPWVGLQVVALAVGALTAANWRASAADSVVFIPLAVGALATAVGADAFTVGGSYRQPGAFLWMPTSGDTRIGGLSTAAISRDGRTVIGEALDARGFENAAIWTAQDQQWRLLGSVSPAAVPCDQLLSGAFGGTDDGKVVVGLAWNGCSFARAFRWDEASGMVDLGSVNGLSTRANAISNDGKVVVGWRTDPTGFRQAAKWVGRQEEVITGPGALLGEAHGINTDATMIVGGSCDPILANSPAWVWTAETGVRCYPVQHPAWLPRNIPYRPIIVDLSDDGRVMVGAYTFGLDSEALLWIDGRVYFLKEFLEQRGLPDAFRRWVNTGFLTAVSRDGRTLVGYGAGPTDFQGYMMILPESAR